MAEVAAPLLWPNVAAEQLLARLQAPVWLFNVAKQEVVYANPAAARIVRPALPDGSPALPVWSSEVERWPDAAGLPPR